MSVAYVVFGSSRRLEIKREERAQAAAWGGDGLPASCSEADLKSSPEDRDFPPETDI